MSAAPAVAAFYPPHVRPAERPLGFPRNLVTLLRNNLAMIPEQAYRESVVVAPGPPRMAFFTGAEAVKTLLLTRHDEFPKGRLQVEALEPIFGNAMISVEGEEWRWQRRAAAPMFRHEELLHYGPAMSEAAEAAVAKWRSAPEGTVHAIDDDMMRATFDVISCAMLTGGAKEMLSRIEEGHADYYAGVNWWLVYRLFKLPHWLPRPGGDPMRAHERRLRETVAELVRARRATAASGNDLLARMLRAHDDETQQSMSDDLAINNIVSFLMAGYDTTAMSLSWTLYLISQSPEWEGRIVEEVECVAGAGPVTADHARALTVVQQVLNESMRLYPTAPIIVRDILEDAEIDGVKVPAGTIGLIPIYALHRHRGFWDDPDRFGPGRFDPVHGVKPSRYQFMPFGAGPRICIGAAFAMMEATIMLATFVRAAHFELAFKRPKPSGQMFLLSKNGMKMRVTPRR